jgi:hypothetical protein
MGYGMRFYEANFFIATPDKQAALHAVQKLALHTHLMSGVCSDADGDTRHYSWVDTAEFLAARTLEDAVAAWGWRLYMSETTEAIVDIIFENEYAGDDGVLFEALAPFVRKNSFIQMAGEDGEPWRWVFTGATVHCVKPKWGPLCACEGEA